MKPPISTAGAAGSISHAAETTVMTVLLAVSFSHMLNDTIQAIIPSLYPMFHQNLKLNYTQLGLITLTFQCTASILQPVVGWVTDRRPMPYSLALGMGITLVGLVLLGYSRSFGAIVLAAAFVGMGSSVFHPEASRVANAASGGRRGLAQSLFQVGGNAGSAIGPLIVATVIMPRGQTAVLWFSILAIAGIALLSGVGRWMAEHLRNRRRQEKSARPGSAVVAAMPTRKVVSALIVLVALVFSKYVYLASMTSYYTFYLMERFGVSAERSQILLFVFLFAVAAGTIAGGPVGDRIGRKPVIWASILGVAPFTLCLPYAGLTATVVLSVVIGVILASAFSAILVYAQELVPGKVGMIAGLFFGLAFGIAGIASAVLGKLADQVGIVTVYQFCSFLPLIGLVACFLPKSERG